MRSSVSVILSSPPPEINMSYPDYDTHPHHHHTLLVLVKQVGGQLKSRSFHKLYERISRVCHVKVCDSNGAQRPVWLTYRRDYPVENNDWGDFQTHRRVLGIISIGQVSSQSDLNDICKQHESLKVKYSATLYDSRCIILGLNPDGSVYETSNSQTDSRNTTPEPNDNVPSSATLNGHVPHPEQENLLNTTHAKKLSAGSADRDSGVYETLAVDDNQQIIGDCNGGSSVESNSNLSESRTDATCVADSTSSSDMELNTQQINGGGSDSGSESTSDMGCGEETDKFDSPRSSTHDSAHDTSQSSISTTTSHSSRVSLQPPPNFKTRALFYPTVDHAVNIESQLQEFIGSLFWVLESKRLDKSQDRLDKPPLLCAPFERKDFVGLDMDSRTNKKRCIGRLRKQLADLSLQVGLPSEAIVHYSHAMDTLKGCNDWLWLAACYEGLCTASVVLLYPNMRRSSGLVRYSSLGMSGVGTGPANGGTNRPRNGSITTNSLPAGLDPSLLKQTSKYCLNADDVVEKYREAIVHYSKYRNAGVVETEASIKAVHVLIEQRKYLMAAEFLSNVVFINLQLSDEEKISRFSALSELYLQIGFHRKASFFRRVAAMRCVAPQNPLPDWSHCYRLLLQTLEGYKVSLDPLEFRKDGGQGWPALQVQILQELVGTSRRMNEHALCTRHQAFLMSAMLPHLNKTERQEVATMLDALSAKCGSTPTPLVVPQTGIIIPAVNFLNIPHCRSIKVLPLSRERRVEKKGIPLDNESNGPFIFSPFASLSSTNKNTGIMDFEWVEGDVCEVCLEFDNPMPFELKITSMMLICEGISFESWTSTVVLPPSSRAVAVTLRGRPQGTGDLKVMGYSTCVLGVNNNCRLKFMPQIKIPHFTVTVVPALPFIQIFCDEASSGTGLVCEGGTEERSSIKLKLNAGETQECNVIVHNVSSQPVESIDLELDSRLNRDTAKQVFQFSQDNLRAQLPIPPGGRASLTLYAYALTDFLCPGRPSDEPLDVGSLISGNGPPSLLSGGPSSLPSRQSTITSSSIRGPRTRRAESTISVASSRSGSSVRSSGSAGSNHIQSGTTQNSRMLLSTPSGNHQVLEGTVKLKYSGGDGLSGDYYRDAEVGVSIEVIPSLLVTRWDALPAELPHQCYIVLDLLNVSQHEMDLQYTANKHLLIEAGESCRVPVPVDRCPLEKCHSNFNKNIGDGGPSISEIVGDHVSSLVELRWILGPQETPGRASLGGITFLPHTHDLITMLPIQWEVEINGSVVGNNTDNNGKVGESLELSVTVTNTSTAELPPLNLRLTAFQDHQNGHHNYRLEAKIAASGSTKVIIPKLDIDGSFTHSCGLVFFTAGVYKIELSCSPAVDCSSAVYENITSSQHHAWKFAPPLEIAVTDN